MTEIYKKSKLASKSKVKKLLCSQTFKKWLESQKTTLKSNVKKLVWSGKLKENGFKSQGQ